MSSETLARLDDLGATLRDAGYIVAAAEIGDHCVLLAETPYALVALVETEDWDGLEDLAFDIQSGLTQIVGDERSVRDWDLYVVIHMLKSASDGQRTLAGSVEADTKYARKLVRTTVSKAALDMALRPLLPLRPAAQFDLVEPLDEMREELRQLKLDDKVADIAVDAFRRVNEVAVI